MANLGYGWQTESCYALSSLGRRTDPPRLPSVPDFVDGYVAIETRD